VHFITRECVTDLGASCLVAKALGEVVLAGNVTLYLLVALHGTD
jgi:hypothetical protein